MILDLILRKLLLTIARERKMVKIIRDYIGNLFGLPAYLCFGKPCQDYRAKGAVLEAIHLRTADNSPPDARTVSVPAHPKNIFKSSEY